MTRTKHIDPNQGELITRLSQAGIEVVADVNADPKPEDGPTVNILERSKFLGNALVALGSASKLTGLEIASDTPRLRRGLEKRYDDVDAVAGRAYGARKIQLKIAKESFARASGHYEMVNADPERKEEVQKLSAEIYSDFLSEFADAKGARNREKMQRKLAKQQRVLTKNK